MEKNNSTRIMVQCAMFIAVAVAVNSISYMLPVAGVANGLKIGLSPIFKKIPCLLFGPWYGAAVCALEDILGNWIFFPKGAPIILLTFVYVIQGIMIGGLFRMINKYWNNKSFAALSFKILIVFLIADTVKTILSSLVLMMYYPGLGKKGFWLVFIPRMTEEILSIIVCTYIDAFLIRIYQRINK